MPSPVLTTLLKRVWTSPDEDEAAFWRLRQSTRVIQASTNAKSRPIPSAIWSKITCELSASRPGSLHEALVTTWNELIR